MRGITAEKTSRVIAATFLRLPRSANTATGIPQAIWAMAPAKITAPRPAALRWNELLISGPITPMPFTMVSVTMAAPVREACLPPCRA